jgi:hypothetical protein
MAGENYVRFNPSDLNSWVYWIRGKDQMASVLLEQGRIRAALDGYQATVALDQDARKPTSLAPMLWTNWATLTFNDARIGDFAAADRSLAETAKAVKSAAALETEAKQKAMFEHALTSLQARVEVAKGNDNVAFDLAAQTADRLRKLELSGAKSNGTIRNFETFRNNVLRNTLATVSLAAIRTGRYGEAEAAARERGTLPPNPYSELDPQDERSRAAVTLAHAIAMQGRMEDARRIIEPEVVRYRAEADAGGDGLTFNRDMAYALYVAALSRAAGDPKRVTELAGASKRLDLLSPEANQLLDVRELRNWIAEAKGGGRG